MPLSTTSRTLATELTLLLLPNLRHRTPTILGQRLRPHSLENHFRTAKYTRSCKLELPRLSSAVWTGAKLSGCETNHLHLQSRQLSGGDGSIQPTTTPTMATLPIEEAKRNAAAQAALEHFKPGFTYVGIGSGTTIVYVVDKIKEMLASAGGSANPQMRFVPTGYQSRQVIVNAGLQPVAFDELPAGSMLDVAFDGADEVDEDLNCIKGGGACLFQEKLVAERAKKFICVADYRKAQTHLLTAWPSIPIEVAPIAAGAVLSSLRDLGSENPRVRDGLLAKAGPLKTDQDFFIIDAPFPRLLTAAEVRERRQSAGTAGSGPAEGGRWEVEELSRRIKAITGVLEVGLFCGWNGIQAAEKGLKAGGQKPVAVYFGMKDGSVQSRKAAGLT